MRLEKNLSLSSCLQEKVSYNIIGNTNKSHHRQQVLLTVYNGLWNYKGVQKAFVLYFNHITNSQQSADKEEEEGHTRVFYPG